MIIAALLIAIPVPAIANVAYERPGKRGIWPICPGYQLKASQRIRFNANEVKLICGDPQAASWETIPKSEAKYFIRVFLQQHGHFYPEFIEEDDVITVIPGRLTHIKNIEVEGTPPAKFNVRKRRMIKGEPLTPDALNELQSWSRGVLRNMGYACPTISSRASAETGHVTLKIEPNDWQRIISVDTEPVEGLRDGTLRRFDAFRIGNMYRYRNLTLTQRRIGADGILQSSYFLTDCTPEGAKLTQKSMPGSSRLISVGLGGSTEELLIGKLTWKQSRLGLNGSSFLVTGRASFRRQRALVQGHVYPFDFPTRWHLLPSFLMNSQTEKKYRYFSNTLFIAPTYTWDTENTRYSVKFGPMLNYTYTYKGSRRGWTHFLSLGSVADVTSHDYEYYLGSPRTGYTLNAFVQLNSDDVYSSATAQKFTLAGHALWNIGGYEPPLLILAIRGAVGTTVTNFNSPNYARLPPWLLYYLGGSQSLRGFSRLQLPNGRGALTSLYTGVELRLGKVIPLNIQPIAFVDVAAMGPKSANIDVPGYWSPGVGFRWPSLIGVVRFTAAHGFLIKNNNPANNNLSHWQFIITLGEEF